VECLVGISEGWGRADDRIRTGGLLITSERQRRSVSSQTLRDPRGFAHRNARPGSARHRVVLISTFDVFSAFDPPKAEEFMQGTPQTRPHENTRLAEVVE